MEGAWSEGGHHIARLWLASTAVAADVQRNTTSRRRVTIQSSTKRLAHFFNFEL